MKLTLFSLLFFLQGNFLLLAQSPLFRLRTDFVLPSAKQGFVLWVDYDKDKDLDLVVSGIFQFGASLTRAYQNNGGKFKEINNFLSTSCFDSELRFGDLNGDGYLDCVIGSTGSEKIVVYKNNQGNNFTEIPAITVENFKATDVALVDYDNDGDLDIALQGILRNVTCGTTIFKLYINRGNFVFQELPFPTVKGFATGVLSWADFDNDKDLDFINAGFVDCSFSKKTMLNENIGQNKFVAREDAILEDKAGGELHWADYNKDGWLDILHTGSGNTYQSLFTKIYENQQGKSFKALDIELQVCATAKWADFNNDNQLDFLLGSGRINNVEKEFASIYFGNNGTFVKGLAFDLSTIGTEFTDVGDYDNDGDIDFFLSGRGIANPEQLSTFIYENQLIPIVPRPLQVAEVTPEHIRLVWDSVPAVAVAPSVQFFLERSINGTTFETLATFKNLELLTYKDSQVKENISYTYRLKATNDFGKVGYSNTVVASLVPMAADNALLAQQFIAAPNPTAANLLLTETTQTAQAYTLLLYDCMGRIVKMQTYNGQLQNYSLDLVNLPVGVYQLCICWENQKVYKKIMKW